MDEAVVVTDPSATVTVPAATPASPAGGAATTPAPSASTGSPAAAPAAPAGKAGGFGTLKGQVLLAGSPPAVNVLQPQGKASKDPEVCAKEGPIPNERLVVDASSKGVKNVLVYIPKPVGPISDEAKSAASQVEIVFDQKNCIFEPHVLGVMNGAKVQVKNSDPVNHNVNSRLRNNGFNTLLAGGQTIARPIEAAERSPGEVTCDIHPWMRAWWMVLDSPYFAVTDAQGNFEIKNVPAGSQKVVVWQEAAKFVTPTSGQDVVIKPDDTTTVPFSIDAKKVVAP
jgi:plastocyanin